MARVFVECKSQADRDRAMDALEADGIYPDIKSPKALEVDADVGRVRQAVQRSGAQVWEITTMSQEFAAPTLKVGDRVFMPANGWQGTVIAVGPGTNVDVRWSNGTTTNQPVADVDSMRPGERYRSGDVVKMDAVKMAADSAGRALSVGDTVEILAGEDAGDRGRVEAVSGEYAVVELTGPGGHLRTSGSNLRKMSLTEAALHMMSSARCPYCCRSVSMSAATLGDHRTGSAVCDGSGRRVAELDGAGRAVLMAAYTVYDFPTSVQYQGITWYRTGKIGRKDGKAVAEYDCRDREYRIWVDVTGTDVRPE